MSTLFLLAMLLLYLSSLLAGLLSGYSRIGSRRLKTRLPEGIAPKGFREGGVVVFLSVSGGGGRAVGILLGDALRYVHSRGLVHGGIKLGNAFLRTRLVSWVVPLLLLIQYRRHS